MFFEFDLATLPKISDIYKVRRRTVWQIVDTSTLLIYISEGRCQITTDNTEYILNEGQLLIIPAGHHYIRKPVENEFCTLYYAHITLPGRLVEPSEAAKLRSERQAEHEQTPFTGAELESPHLYMSPQLCDLRSSGEDIPALYEGAISAKLKNAPDFRTTEAMNIIRILLLAARSGAPEADAPRSEPERLTNVKLQKVFAYIHLHAKESVTLDDLCGVCNFSKQHLIRVFNSEFGMPPKTYIQNYRINCAKELFYRNPHVSVKEVADEMGFADQHYFSRLFTRLSGVTPTAYKNHLLTFDPTKQ